MTRQEIAHDVLAVTSDLVLILPLLADDQLRLVGGGALTMAYPPWLEAESADDDRPEDALDEFGSVLLPRGTMAGLGVLEGDLVSLTITPQGVQLAQIEEGDLHPHPDAVRQRWAEIVSGDKPTEFEGVVLSVCADIGAAFRVPHSPLTELLADIGIARHGDWVASASPDTGPASRSR